MIVFKFGCTHKKGSQSFGKDEMVYGCHPNLMANIMQLRRLWMHYFFFLLKIFASFIVQQQNNRQRIVAPTFASS